MGYELVGSKRQERNDMCGEGKTAKARSISGQFEGQMHPVGKLKVPIKWK